MPATAIFIVILFEEKRGEREPSLKRQVSFGVQMIRGHLSGEPGIGSEKTSTWICSSLKRPNRVLHSLCLQ